ncbi:scavenger receptor cysteine-rich domain superfamily protein-like isoform X6 [Halichondria panicea]|uniref:scavenger receptor cysteine-rich domain superfamily protein-like isoform X6 n=1 Tax=Halichondria panicea TaxID=6063 RepID=UPI00312BADB7
MASICLVLLTVVIVGQILADGQVCNNGAVQLVRYGSFNEEYIQFCHDGEWHSLCAGGGTWSRVEANVVCRQLGLSGHGANKGGGSTVPANQSYFIISGTCTGREYNIGECKGISYPSTCGTSRKGWVDCQPANCTDGTVRLVGGSTNREGRVDVCTQGHWASICYNEDLELAGTICKMLGFPMQGAMANSTTSSIDPKVDCTVTDDGTTLNCGDTIQSHVCGAGSLVIECQTHNSAVQISATATPTTTSMEATSPITSALGAVIGLLVLLEVGTVIAWVACTVTRKRNSSSPKQRILTKVNESYNGTFLKTTERQFTRS